jgi:raffinose/stachyose/melibiose transport system permease protein
MNRTKTVPVQYLKYFLLSVVAAIQVYPLLWLILFSFKTNDEIFGLNVLGFPQKFLWQNYEYAFKASPLALYFFNSAFVTAATIVVSGILACMVSYAVARMKVKWNKWVLLFFSLGLMIPTHSVLLPDFILLRNFKMLNTYQALIFPYVAFALPMAIFILVSFFQTLPKELEESAFLDGSNIFQTFFHIILPLIKSAIATVSIFTFLSVWNEMMFAITFAGKESIRTLVVGIFNMKQMYMTNWGAFGAGLVIATLPTILVYVIFSDQVEKSMTAGAVKG